LCAYPIEAYLANTPAAFEKAEASHRIYEAFRDWTGVQGAFQSDQASVEVTSLRGDHRGYAVVVNHSGQPYLATISTSLPLKSVRELGPDSSKALALEGSHWKIDLKPYEAAVVEWK
ncbi:MAG: hypothetical protein WCA47_02160, partial [Terriglobales bacterium]